MAPQSTIASQSQNDPPILAGSFADTGFDPISGHHDQPVRVAGRRGLLTRKRVLVDQFVLDRGVEKLLATPNPTADSSGGKSSLVFLPLVASGLQPLSIALGIASGERVDAFVIAKLFAKTPRSDLQLLDRPIFTRMLFDLAVGPLFDCWHRIGFWLR